MKKLLVAVCLLGACSKASPEKACRHMIDLAAAQLDKEVAEESDPSMKRFAEGMRAQMLATMEADFDNCAKSFEQYNVDVGCVTRADTVAEAVACVPEAVRKQLK